MTSTVVARLHLSPPVRVAKSTGNDEDAEFDAALEKRRSDRKKKKTEQHSNLDRLVDVAARLEHLEEELGKATADKAPDEALLTCVEWEILKQGSAEKGQTAREQAAREYEERQARRDAQEQTSLRCFVSYRRSALFTWRATPHSSVRDESDRDRELNPTRDNRHTQCSQCKR